MEIQTTQEGTRVVAIAGYHEAASAVSALTATSVALGEAFVLARAFEMQFKRQTRMPDSDYKQGLRRQWWDR